MSRTSTVENRSASLNVMAAGLLLFALGGCGDGQRQQPASSEDHEAMSDSAGPVGATDQADSQPPLTPSAPSYTWPHDDPWFGDLDGMTERRLIRALVVYNDLLYFLEGPRQRGMTYEYLKQFERYLNDHLRDGAPPVHVLCIAVRRDQLVPWLLQGKGDIAAAALSITQERRQQVDFSAPFASNIRQILVTGPTAPPIEVREDLAIHRGGQIAWAFRKKSPRLKARLDDFVADHKQGTLYGNILVNRYLKDDRRLRKRGEQQGFGDIARLFKVYAKQYEFDWMLLAAIAYQESGWDQAAKGPRGAIGIMQVIPTTARDPNVDIPNIERIEDNIHAGTKYLRFIYDRYFSYQPMDDTNTLLFTIAAYNAGPARIAELRKAAEEEGLDPGVWFNSVERVAAKQGQYLRNIYSYYLAYRLVTAKQTAPP